MPAIRVLERSGRIQRDAFGIQSAVDCYLVDATQPSAAAASNDLPSPGSLYPGTTSQQAVLASGYSVGEFTGSQFFVDVIYTRNGQNLSFAPVDRTDPQYSRTESRSFAGEIEIPIIRRIDEYVFEGPTQQGVKKTFRWSEPDMQKVAVVRNSYVVEFNHPGWGEAQIAAVSGQVNKIHTFAGRDWLFTGAIASQSARSDYHSVTYNWEGDDGLPLAALQNAGFYSGNNWNKATNADQYIKQFPPLPPFGVYLRRPLTGPPAVPPGYDLAPAIDVQIDTFVPYAKVATGFQSLPGYGTLWG